MKQITVAIAGVGSRGCDTYGAYQEKFPQRMKIVALAEPRAERLQAAAERFGVPASGCFSSAEELLAQPKLADVLILATMDRQHVAQAIPALEKGYDLLLEKPVSPDKAEILALQQKAHETGRIVAVCHVLRYTPFYTAIKRLIDGGRVGEVVSVQAIENVGYWHQAHSFVRGNWRDSRQQSPMILQKSCHDMDILLFLIGKKCLRLSSFGGLYLFKPEMAPEGAAARCLDGCRCKADCPFDAEKIYIHNSVTGVATGCTEWPCDVLTPHPTQESVMQALRDGPYGRCVYHCDNDVVDHQVVSMEFEGGTTAVFTMSGLTKEPSREIKIMGTKGQIVGDMNAGLVTLSPFGQPEETVDIKKLTADLDGHGGGDHRMMSGLFDLIEGRETDMLTNIDVSVQSHLMALAAEESRLDGGRAITL